MPAMRKSSELPVQVCPVCGRPFSFGKKLAQQLGRGALLLGKRGRETSRTMAHFGLGRMKTLRLVLGDQLSRDISALRDIDPIRDVVLMVEVGPETTYVRHHKQKIVLVLSGCATSLNRFARRGSVWTTSSSTAKAIRAPFGRPLRPSSSLFLKA